jgi:hypothetical protein
MSKRRDPEAVIVQYFSTAEPEAAGTLYRVIRGILDARGFLPTRGQAPVSPPVRRRRAHAAAVVPVNASRPHAE